MIPQKSYFFISGLYVCCFSAQLHPKLREDYRNAIS